MTFLHDANGLVIGPDEPRPDLTLVVVNDDGGSIFATLEQGAEPYAPAFERVFGTPHGVDLEALCGASGTAYTRVDTRGRPAHRAGRRPPRYAGGRGPGRPVPAARHGGGDHRPGRRAGTIEPMSTSTPSLTRSSLTLAAGTMASRLLGVVRQSLIVLAIGQGLVGNAFQTANNLPNVIYMLIAGGVLNSVLVPQIVKAMRLPDGGREYTDRIITLSTAGMLVVTAALHRRGGLVRVPLRREPRPGRPGAGHLLRRPDDAADLLLRPLRGAGTGAQRAEPVRRVRVGSGGRQRLRDRRPAGVHGALRRAHQPGPVDRVRWCGCSPGARRSASSRRRWCSWSRCGAPGSGGSHGSGSAASGSAPRPRWRAGRSSRCWSRS